MTLMLIVFSPAVSGTPTAMLPHLDFHWFPLSNPGILTIPLRLVLGIVGTLTSTTSEDPSKASEMAAQIVTGIDLPDTEHQPDLTASR